MAFVRVCPVPEFDEEAEAEWAELLAELREPAPPPRGQLVSLDAASIEALQREAAKQERKTNELDTPMGRPLDEGLRVEDVEKAEERLRQRRETVPSGGRGSGPITYEAIAKHSGLNRDRVKQLEELLGLGWPLRKSHPDSFAKPGYVRLPTSRQAAQLLRSSRPL